MSIWSVLDHYLGFLDHNLEFSHREIFGDVNLTGGLLLISFLLITLTFVSHNSIKRLRSENCLQSEIVWFEIL